MSPSTCIAKSRRKTIYDKTCKPSASYCKQDHRVSYRALQTVRSNKVAKCPHNEEQSTQVSYDLGFRL